MLSHNRLFIYYVITINVIAYIVMWFDKRQAIKKQNRVSEKKLFVIALMMGALGIYAGMKAPLYHKAAKPLFKIGIPIAFILNVFVVYLGLRK
jgi:uncharacterized membrane protein YsdA (DUF1294 family)